MMRMTLSILTVAIALHGVACERAGSPPGASTAAPGPRIVAHSPAIARMLVDVGLEDSIVGRHAFDLVLRPDVPVVGDTNALDYERLLAVRPTDVILQHGQRAIPDRLEDLADQHGWNVVSYDIDSLDDIRATLLDLPERVSFGDEASNRRAAASTRARRIAAQLDAVLVPDPTLEQAGTMLMLFGVDPPYAFGPRAFFAEMATRMGARNALTEGDYVRMSLEDVLNLDPDVIVLVMEADPSTTWRDLAGPVARLQIGAVVDDRVAVVRHPLALLPSSSIIEVAPEFVAEIRAVTSDRTAAEGSP
jgi:ABC-type Fe3+-hydroxamate transport system substrate-binding protein